MLAISEIPSWFRNTAEGRKIVAAEVGSIQADRQQHIAEISRLEEQHCKQAPSQHASVDKAASALKEAEVALRVAKAGHGRAAADRASWAYRHESAMAGHKKALEQTANHQAIEAFRGRILAEHAALRSSGRDWLRGKIDQRGMQIEVATGNTIALTARLGRLTELLCTELPRLYWIEDSELAATIQELWDSLPEHRQQWDDLQLAKQINRAAEKQPA